MGSGGSLNEAVHAGPVTGLITNIQKCSLHDGPGIRTTVFLKGCPLSCAWCHNPENIDRQPEVVTLESRCVRCGQCVAACPQPPPQRVASDPETGMRRPLITPPDCLRCGACVEACPSGARTMLGRRLTVGEVLEEVGADRLFYEQSGGGLTVSGGEPLLQFEFVQALLEGARARGLHTALDTCGLAPPQHLLALLPFVDLFLYDVKLMDEARHVEFTGVSNRLILDNLRLLARQGAPLWLRIPIIPGVNDHASDLAQLARFAIELGGVQQVNLLPYHSTGRVKFGRLNLPSPLPDLEPPTSEAMRAALRHFTDCGLCAKMGG
jgi:pyruvate formate lyase activating enzyme